MGLSSMLPAINSLGISMLFLKVFGVLRTFAIFAAGKFAPSASEEVSKKVLSRRRPFSSFPYKLQLTIQKTAPSRMPFCVSKSLENGRAVEGEIVILLAGTAADTQAADDGTVAVQGDTAAEGDDLIQGL